MAEFEKIVGNGNYEFHYKTTDCEKFKILASTIEDAISAYSKPKIKATFAEIVVHFPDNKPYYEILYYDTADNAWHTGYSSYNLDYVVEWLKTEFEISKANIEPVRNGYWIHESLGHGHCRYKCSECGAIFSEDQIVEFKHNKFCSDCGADMRG